MFWSTDETKSYDIHVLKIQFKKDQLIGIKRYINLSTDQNWDQHIKRSKVRLAVQKLDQQIKR